MNNNNNNKITVFSQGEIWNAYKTVKESLQDRFVDYYLFDSIKIPTFYFQDCTHPVTVWESVVLFSDASIDDPVKEVKDGEVIQMTGKNVHVDSYFWDEVYDVESGRFLWLKSIDLEIRKDQFRLSIPQIEYCLNANEEISSKINIEDVHLLFEKEQKNMKLGCNEATAFFSSIPFFVQKNNLDFESLLKDVKKYGNYSEHSNNKHDKSVEDDGAFNYLGEKYPDVCPLLKQNFIRCSYVFGCEYPTWFSNYCDNDSFIPKIKSEKMNAIYGFLGFVFGACLIFVLFIFFYSVYLVVKFLFCCCCKNKKVKKE